MNLDNDVKQLWLGLALIAGAIIWFVGGLFFGYVFYYPGCVMIAGIVATVRGIIALASQSKKPALPPGMYRTTQQPGYPGQMPVYPGQQMGYPPQQPGYPPQQPGYPGQQMGGYGGYAPPSQGAQPMPYGMPATPSQQMFGMSKPCWNCSKPVTGNPTTCPTCGAPQSTPTS